MNTAVSTIIDLNIIIASTKATIFFVNMAKLTLFQVDGL